MRIVECEQGSAQWLQERVGRITASRVSEVLSKYARGKEGETAERRNYRIDLIVERLTGVTTENFVSPEMIWGRDNEDSARSAYEMENQVLVERVGFVLHPTLDYAGASPDGLIGNDGGLEIKCPKPATHYRWREENRIPPEHEPQLLKNMLCCEREWWDFQSFDPRFPDGVNSFIKRMYRDELRIKAMEEEIVRFNDEIESALVRDRKLIKILEPKTIDTRSEYDQLMEVMDRAELVP